MGSEVIREIRRLTEEVARKHEVLSNPFRLSILSIVSALGEASWSSIKSMLEEVFGPVNPNTLAFHIRKLIGQGLLSRSGTPENPVYTANIPEDFKREISAIVDLYREIGG